MKTITCIGHITRDHIVTPTSDVSMPGGTTYYFSYGINALLKSSPLSAASVSYRLVASLAESDMKSVDDMRAEGIDVTVVPSRETVFFENIYGADSNNRRQQVLAKADPFTLSSIRDIKADYIVLGSLLADDFPLDVVRYLHGRGTVVLDAQGYLREVRGTSVVACPWSGKDDFLRYIDILKVNEHEAEVLTGEHDLRRAAMMLHEQGVREVLLTLGSYGSMVAADGNLYDIPVVPERQKVDATGCGDSYVLGYLYRRAQGDSPRDAALFASAVATVNIEAHGPFRATEAEVLSRLREMGL